MTTNQNRNQLRKLLRLHAATHGRPDLVAEFPDVSEPRALCPDHKSYMYKQGNGWIVAHWDVDRGIYRVSGEKPYGVARAEVGSANCPHAADGKCDKITHYHYKLTPAPPVSGQRVGERDT